MEAVNAKAGFIEPYEQYEDLFQSRPLTYDPHISAATTPLSQPARQPEHHEARQSLGSWVDRRYLGELSRQIVVACGFYARHETNRLPRVRERNRASSNLDHKTAPA